MKSIEVIGRGVLIRDGHVLLCEAVDGEYFYLPGGHVEPGESAADAVRRELLEETGWLGSIGCFLFAGEHRFTQRGRSGRLKPKHEINLVFHVEQLAPADPSEAVDGGLPGVPSAETELAFRWVDLAAVVDLDVRPASIKAWLASGAGAMSPAWVSEGG